MIGVGALLAVSGCSSSTDGDSLASAAQATSTPAPVPTDMPEPTATMIPAAPVPTEVSDEPEPVPASPPAAPTAPEPAEPDPTEPDQPAVGAIQAPPDSGGSELLHQGLLQDQFCVVDIVAPDTLNVRTGPSTNDSIVHELVEGQCRIYLAGGQSDGWQEIIVDLPDTEIRGWVSSKFIAVQRAPIDPDAPMVLITIGVEFGVDTQSPVPLDAFRLVNADGLVVGYLDAGGQITVPVDMDLSRAFIEAEFANDRYCAWTGPLRFEGSDNRYTSFLGALCA